MLKNGAMFAVIYSSLNCTFGEHSFYVLIYVFLSQDALLASIAESETQTELATRVSSWKQKIEKNLEEQVKVLN